MKIDGFIEVTGKTAEELKKIQERYPNGHISSRGDKVFWVFDEVLE